MRKSGSIKLKIFFLYLILFTTVCISGVYIYKEAKNFTIPETQIFQEHNKVFLVTSTINNLYNSEAYSRTALISGSQKEINTYFIKLDSIVTQIEAIQKDLIADKVVIGKLDKVKTLVDRKKQTFNQLILARKQINEFDYNETISKIHSIREKIEDNINPIIIETRENRKRSAWARLFKGDHTDTITKTINHPAVSDSLISAIEDIVFETQEKIKAQQQGLYLQEQKILEENKNITDQLRDILENVEQSIVSLSYQKINESKSLISNASTNIAYIGGTALIVIVILGWIIIKDINQTQEYRIALENLNKEKEVLLRSKTMLLATVTHDLQTPLGGLIGFSNLLAKTTLNEKQQQYVSNIKHSSEYINNLINDLTDFSRLENNKINIQRKAVSIQEVIENTCAPLVPAAQNKKIELNWEISEQLNSTYETDPYRLKQVLTNLISNAIKFTQKGEVNIIAQLEDGNIVISVIDTGIGIENSQIDNIFKEFRQAHEGIEKKFGGTGLGLNISKRLIELLHGKISVESHIGLGSTFKISIPAITKEIEIEASSDLTQQKFKHLLDCEILVIDDDKIQLQLMEELFSPMVKRIITCHDATEFTTILEENKTIDIILTDIQMPKLDGFEVLQRLQNSHDFKHIPIIAISGKKDLSLEDFIEAGFTSAHSKPIHITDLFKQISQILFPNEIFSNEDAQDLIEETPSNENSDINKLYELRSLHSFIGDDKEAMTKLLVIFIESTLENLIDLNYAKEEFDIETISQLAHKMLPMFKQLEIGSVINELESLEDKNITFSTQQELTDYLLDLEKNIKEVLDEIKQNELSA